MDTKAQSGYLVLADISGYTSFLAATELEHAHEILSDLLELIVKNFKPVLTISKLEGDAVFGYVSDTTVPRGEILLELVEATYVRFRDRVRNSTRHTTCECEACRKMPNLDLKFIIHHGEYILQHVAGITELVGSDVNLAHRLMKNHVADQTGWHAYALFTEAALEKMCVRPCDAVTITETYEHLGDVVTHSLDLHRRYNELKEAQHVIITPDKATASLSMIMHAPQAVTWDWMTNPRRRTEVMEGRAEWSEGPRPAGRTAAGARNHCAHGKQTINEDILDWRPFDYYTCHMVMMGKLDFTCTFSLEPVAEGTRVTGTAQVTMNGMPRWAMRPIGQLIMNKFFVPDWKRMAAWIDAEYRAQASRPELTEPALSNA